MDLGFTESKLNSILYFKVEYQWCSCYMLMTCSWKKKWNSLNLQEGNLMPSSRWKTWVWALLSRHGGVEECRWNLHGTREVCSGDPKEVQNDGIQCHDHTYDIEPWAIECFFIKWLMPRCIVRWLGHWCTWRIRDQIFAFLWTHWASSWQIRDMFTWLLQSIFWGTWRVQLTMGSSMKRIRRLT